jgi:hypothetical protein
MSLNRRLYAWFLGNENTTQAQMLYFATYAEKAATQAIKSMFHENKNTNNDQDDTLSMADAQRPYKTLISLMDKWEIGQPIVNNVFIDALKSLQSQMERYPDITQTANMWVDMVEPYLICIKLFELVDTCFPGNNNNNNKNQQRQQSSNLESIKLMEFTLKSLKLTDDEIKHIHLPLILAALSKKLNDSIKNPVFIEILPQVGECISLITLILDQLPESIFFNRSPPDIPGAEGDEEAEVNERKQFKAGMDVLDYVREFYNIGQPQSNTNNVVEEFMESEKNEEQGDLSATSQLKPTPSNMAPMVRPEFDPLRGQVLVKEVTDNITGFLIELVNNYIVLPDDLMSGVDVGVEGKRLKHIESRLQTVLHTACAVLTRLARYADKTIQLKPEYKEELTQVLLKCCQQGNEFGVVDAGLSTLTTLVKKKRFVLGAILRQSSHVVSIMDKVTNIW